MIEELTLCNKLSEANNLLVERPFSWTRNHGLCAHWQRCAVVALMADVAYIDSLHCGPGQPLIPIS